MRDEAVADGRMCWADVAVALQRAVRCFDDYVAPVLEAHEVPALGLSNVLFLLSIGSAGNRRMADVAREERYQGSNASYAIGVLGKAGLVRTAFDPDDRRMRLVGLTRKGRRLNAEIRRVSVGDDRAITQALRASALLVAASSRAIPEVRGADDAAPLMIALDAVIVFGHASRGPGPGSDAMTGSHIAPHEAVVAAE